MQKHTRAVLKSEAAQVAVVVVPVIAGGVVDYHVENLFRPLLGDNASWVGLVAGVLMVVWFTVLLHISYGPDVAKLKAAADAKAAQR